MRIPIAAMLAVVLAGCASVPPPLPLDARASAQALSARRLDDPGLAVALARVGLPAAASAAWTPDRITVAALYFNPRLARARAAALQAAAAATLAAQRTNPTLQLSPERVFSGGLGRAPWTVGLALLVPLLHPGEAAARDAMRRAETLAAQDRYAEAVWQTRSRALAALRTLLLARREVDLAANTARAGRDFVAAAQQRLRLGAGDRGQLLAAELAAARAESTLATRQADRVAARQALAAAIGVPAAALDGIALDWPGLDTPPAPAALPSAALADDAAWNRLDLAVLLQRYRVAEAGLREAAGTRYPTLAVAPGYIYDRGAHKWALGIDAQLPLFHGAGARIRAAATARDEAAAAVLARQARILHQLAGARAGYAQRYTAWRQLAAAARAAAQRAAQAEAQRAAGRIDRPAALAARAVADQAALTATTAEGAALATLAQLEDAVQRPLWPISHLPAAAALATSITIAAPAPTGEVHDR